MYQSNIFEAMEEVHNYINSVRRDFAQQSLSEKDVNSNPIEQFSIWIEDAINAQILDPYAMVLSTVSNNKPSSRVLYLRGISEKGFEFFTNYNSQKGKELNSNPNASLNFLWMEIERQVRVEGQVIKMTSEESDAYFNARPRESKIGAWASSQSTEIKSRSDLEESFGMFMKQFDNKEVPRPPHWGGYRLIPEKVELWQGRPSRLHDRILYRKQNKDWKITRLMP